MWVVVQTLCRYFHVSHPRGIKSHGKGWLEENEGACLRQGLALDFPETGGLKVSPDGGIKADESLFWAGSQTRWCSVGKPVWDDLHMTLESFKPTIQL